MGDRLTLGSLFSGSGSFELGGLMAGILPVWNSEIEPFPVMVTRRRLPFVKHYGDVARLDGAKIEPVDIVTFGSPCQDMSVAGKRAGLDGERSGLFWHAIRIVSEMREATHGEKPRYIVWENVPGAFSSNGGRDFGAVLDAVAGIAGAGASVPAPEKGGWPKADLLLGDGWSLAYRVLDAQYWGVAQRRRRIYLVADLAGERAGEILFERSGLQGDTGQGGEARQGAAGNAAGSAGGRGFWCLNPQGNSGVGLTEEHAGTLVAQDHGHHPAVLAAGFLANTGSRANSIGYAEELAPTVRCGEVPAVVGAPEAFGVGSYHSLAWLSGNPRAGVYRTETARTLDAKCGYPACSQGGTAVVARALLQRDYKGAEPVADGLRVRRLTPVECARLQGFPDWWCDGLGIEEPDEAEIGFWTGVFADIGKRKSRKQVVKWIRDPYTDGAAYKLWGNGCALPCVFFVLAGIAAGDG